jgi:hypothetical protein
VTKALYPAERYTYRVLWAADRQRYIGVCTEFPVLTYEAMTSEDALAGIIARVRGVLEEMSNPPKPLSIRLLGKEHR